MKQSIYNLMKIYDTEDKCREFFIKARWGKNIECPHCGNNPKTGKKIYKLANGPLAGDFRCNACGKKFSVRTNSFMSKSTIPYSKWLMAIYFVTGHKKGISSMQLARNIGVTQKTAWFMIQRIFNIVNPENTVLKGVVEVDETYVGGKEKNKHKSRKTLNHNKIAGDKVAILGMIERGGKLVLKRFEKINRANIQSLIDLHIDKQAIVNTDESPIYKGALNGRTRQMVNHKAGIYGIGDITTNRIEGVFSHFKRMINGVHIFVTSGHIQKYADMFCFRRDTMNMLEFDRMELLLNSMNDTRIMYNQVSCHGDTGTNIRLPYSCKGYGK